MNNDFLTGSCSGGCSSCSICGPTESAMNYNGIKPLGKITAILADLGLEVTYAYDDLVFVQQSAFLLQFTGEPKTIKLFTNAECDSRESNTVASNIVLAFHDAALTVNPSGHYTISQNNDGTVGLTFY